MTVLGLSWSPRFFLLPKTGCFDLTNVQNSHQSCIQLPPHSGRSEAVSEWCHIWSNVLKRWKGLLWGNYHQHWFSCSVTQNPFAFPPTYAFARAVSKDKIFSQRGRLSSGIFCQPCHLRASALTKFAVQYFINRGNYLGHYFKSCIAYPVLLFIKRVPSFSFLKSLSL